MSRRITIFLLQARREDDPACAEERRSFAEKAGGRARIVAHNLLEGPPSLARIRSYDALAMGGSGEYLVSEGNLPRFPALLERLRGIVEHGHPTFASCFGFQCLVEALGGKIVFDPPTMELGTFPLTLSAEGRKDDLLGGLPPTFLAQLGHKDKAERLPAGVLNLASSARCRYQALRVPGKPIWATQFHPELTAEENRERYLRYAAIYSRFLSRQGHEEVLERFEESPEASALIARFVDLVFG